MEKKFKAGDFYEKEYLITEDIGKQFADVSGDYNPIHLEEEIASKTRFGRKIVHGMLIGSYISGIIGNEFPGNGSVYLKQDLSFRRPVYYNSKVKIRIEVAEVNIEKKRLTLSTQCFDSEENMLVDGKALILFEGLEA